MNAYTSGTCTYDMTALSQKVAGVVEITGYTSVTVVTGTVTETLGGTDAVTTWNEGSFSDDNGYPQALAFYNERLALAGTDQEPQTIWLSQTDDWDNFLTGSLATDALRYTLASDVINEIQWLNPQKALLIGTLGAEWSLSATGSDEPLASDNFSASRHSTYGSDLQQAMSVNNLAFFVQRQGKKIRQLQYEWASDNYVAPDLTILAEHLAADGIKQLALQRSPYTILWAVTDAGDLLSLTFEEFEEVLGWAVHTFEGDVESVAVIPGSGEDEIWLSVERTVNSNTARYIEQVQPFTWDTQRDAFFVDSGLSYDGGAAVTVTNITRADPAVVSATAHGFTDGDNIRFADIAGMTDVNDAVFSVGSISTNSFELRDYADTTDIDSTGFSIFTGSGSVEVVENVFTGLTHLAYETVDAAGDGGYAGSYTVTAAGVITLDDYYNTVHIGLPYTCLIKPQALEFPASGGRLQGMTKRIIALTARFFDTLGCDIGPSYTDYESLVFRDSEDALEAAPPLYTGDKRILFSGPWTRGGDICVQQRRPLPFTLLSLPRIEFEVNQ